MKPVLFILGGIALILAWVAWRREPGLVGAGLLQGGRSALEVLPVMLLTFVIAGFFTQLVPKDVVLAWIGNESGWRGIALGCLAGVLAPGGPLTMFPLVGLIQQAGAGIGTLVALVTAWSMWGVRMILLESALISPRFALFKFLSCFFVPLLAGGIAHLAYGRFWK
ncbi:MAG: permease [Azonexus sp.]|nr:hypothetical protein [Azonexus sp.]MCK6412410.1 permease [Azonexus sp.]